MKKISDLDAKKMTKDFKTPIVVIGGVIVGNYATNTLIPKVIDNTGVEGLLGAVATDNTKTILKIAVPIGVGLAGYQLFEDKHAKNFSIGIAGSGVLNGATMLINAKMPQIAQRALTVNGLGDTEGEPKAIDNDEAARMLDVVEDELTKIEGVRSLPAVSSFDEEDFGDVDDLDFSDDDDFEIGAVEEVEYEDAALVI